MDLLLTEELMLLALDDEKGTIVPHAGTSLDFGLAGAVLIELKRAGLIRIENHKVIPADGLSASDQISGEPLLDTCWQQIRKAHISHTVRYWISRLGGKMHPLRAELIDGLVRKGILEKKAGRVLWLFKSSRYPMVNSAYENRLRARIRAIVLENHQPDMKEYVLLALIKACSLLPELFPDAKEQQTAIGQMDSLLASNQYAEAIDEAVQEIQQMILNVAIMGVVR